MEFQQPDQSLKDLFYPFSGIMPLQDLPLGMYSFAQRWLLVQSKPAASIHPLQLPYRFPSIENITHLVLFNAEAIRNDFDWSVANRVTQKFHPTNNILATDRVFLDEGAQMRFCTINAEEGPVYIGKNALVMEGTNIRGPVSIGANTVIKMGAKIYPGTSIGNNCVVGGEVKNSLLMNCSNKAHDGYLGDSIIGEWCNLGAGTSNSNLKNTGGEILLQLKNIGLPAGRKFGLLMGNYSRAAINTSFNTGTVVGLCCHIFGNQDHPRFITDFSWGNQRYEWDKALAHIQNWKQFKGQNLTEEETNKLKQVYNQLT